MSVKAKLNESSHSRGDQRPTIESKVLNVLGQIGPTWSLENFIAVNPLLHFENENFSAAHDRARTTYSTPTELEEKEYIHLYAAGRISEQDLASAAADYLALDTKTDLTVSEVIEELTEHLPDEPFQVVPVLISEIHDRAFGTRCADHVDTLSSWWCSQYLGDHPAYEMPHRENGLFTCWLRFAPRDRRFVAVTKSQHNELIAQLPRNEIQACEFLMHKLSIAEEDQKAYITRHLVRHLGWVSALVRAGSNEYRDVFGYLAIRLALEFLIVGRNRDELNELFDQSPALTDEPTAELHSLSDVQRKRIWRNAFEKSYVDAFLQKLQSRGSAQDKDEKPNRPATQTIFCIDPRSEGMRRHLESQGDNETIGFAGFFGLPVSIKDVHASDFVASCPAILEPQAEISEQWDKTNSVVAARKEVGERELRNAHDVFAATKRTTGTPFIMAEATGWIAGPMMALKTFAPYWTSRITQVMRKLVSPEIQTTLAPVSESWWNIEEQTAIAESILKMTGIIDNAAPVVLLCGHGSHHVNNLHRSALDCGACGGRSGGNNARVAARILNDLQVRERLEQRGVYLPSDTWFVAGEHETTTDEVTLFDLHLVPDTHHKLINTLQEDLRIAGESNARERLQSLPGTLKSKARRIKSRNMDWSQVIAEWGLINNAALVIGPRSLTSEMNLDRRVFLHNYEVARDEDGSILATILGGPMVVAHWISSQYRMSRINQEKFGAGKKPVHNLVGGVGVLEGYGGDIRLGLPLESVSVDGYFEHEPMRLLVVIDAPRDKVLTVMDENSTVEQLIDNGWVRVVCKDSRSSQWEIMNATAL